jgi:hypothetical protein
VLVIVLCNDVVTKIGSNNPDRLLAVYCSIVTLILVVACVVLAFIDLACFNVCLLFCTTASNALRMSWLVLLNSSRKTTERFPLFAVRKLFNLDPLSLR